MRARVGPFECNTAHRFSDFLRLQRELQQAFPKRKFPPSALKLREQKLQLQPHRGRLNKCPGFAAAHRTTHRTRGPSAWFRITL